jgi:hypothetical protein
VESLQARIFRPRAPYEQRIAWSDNRLASTDALAGKNVALERDDGKIVTFAFDSSTVSWKEPGETSTTDAPYHAVELREGVFSVDILHPERPGESTRAATSLALNMQTVSALIVRNTIALGAKRDFHQDIYPCTIAGSGGTLPAISAELVGRRVYAEYSDGRAAEHVYLNPRRFAWQGLGGFDYSGAGCEDSTTWKLGDDLFALTWVEEWEPTGVVLLMDFAGLRNAGVILGEDDQGFFHFPCGARLTILGRTDYPPGYEPAGLAAP